MTTHTQEEKYNCTVWINKIRLVLWGRAYVEPAFLDNLESPTLVETKIKGRDFKQRLTRASDIEIIFIKYLLVFLLIGVLNTFSFHPDSTTGLGLMGIAYIIGYYLKRKFSFQTMIISLIVFISIVLIYGFYSFVETGRFGFGFVANYMVQYFLIIYALHHIYDDLLKKGYKDYWKIENNLFSYMKILDRKEDAIVNKRGKYFLIILLVVSLSSLTLGVLDIWKNYVVEQSVIQKLNKVTETNEKRSLDNYGKNELERLDREAFSVGTGQLHRMNIKNIKRYEILRIDKSVKYAKVPLKKTGVIKHGKSGKIVNSYNMGTEPIGKTISYSEDLEFMDVQAFVVGEYWYFILVNDIYKIVSVKAVNASGR